MRSGFLCHQLLGTSKSSPLWNKVFIRAAREREMHKIPAWYGWYVFNTYCVRIREWWDAHQFLTAKMEQG